MKLPAICITCFLTLVVNNVVAQTPPSDMVQGEVRIISLQHLQPITTHESMLVTQSISGFFLGMSYVLNRGQTPTYYFRRSPWCQIDFWICDFEVDGDDTYLLSTQFNIWNQPTARARMRADIAFLPDTDFAGNGQDGSIGFVRGAYGDMSLTQNLVPVLQTTIAPEPDSQGFFSVPLYLNQRVPLTETIYNGVYRVSLLVQPPADFSIESRLVPDYQDGGAIAGPVSLLDASYSLWKANFVGLDRIPVLGDILEVLIDKIAVTGYSSGGAAVASANITTDGANAYLLSNWNESPSYLVLSARGSTKQTVSLPAVEIEVTDMYLGDIDGSNEIDSADIDCIGEAFGSAESDPEWYGEGAFFAYSIADLDRNGEVDTADVGVALGNFGEVGS